MEKDRREAGVIGGKLAAVRGGRGVNGEKRAAVGRKRESAKKEEGNRWNGRGEP
jgi:hypothetical protein